MGTAENKETFRRFINMLNARDLSALDEVVHEECVYRTSDGDEYHGIDSMKGLMETSWATISDLEFHVQEVVAEGNSLACLYQWTGTHDGSGLGIEPTNNQIDLMVSGFAKFQDGKIIESYDSYNMLDFLSQLGALPEGVMERAEEVLIDPLKSNR